MTTKIFQSISKNPLRQLDLFILPVFLSYILEISTISVFFPSQSIKILSSIILIPLNILFYSGVYGAIIDAITFNETTINILTIIKNAKLFWKPYLLLSSIFILSHLIIYIIFPSANITLLLIHAHLDILFIYIFLTLLINRKYLSSYKIPSRKISIDIKSAVILTILYALYLIISYGYIFTKDFYLSRGLMFILKYIHFLVYIYLSIFFLKGYPEIIKNNTSNTEIFLIEPTGGGIFYTITSFFFRNYSPVFTILKALSPKYYTFKEFSCNLWQNRFYDSGKLVAITCFTSNCLEAYKIAKEFKKKGSKVIMGGPHVTFMKNEALEFCDSVVVGEVIGLWEIILKDYERNSLKKVYIQSPGKQTISESKKLKDNMLLMPAEQLKFCLKTTYGCKFNCFFCTIPSLSGGKIHTESIEYIISSIKKIRKKSKSIFFLDNNIYANPKYAKQLFKALIPLNIKWSASCSIDIAKDKEILKLAKQSGCTQLLFGYEIPHNSPQEYQKGKLSIANQYKELTKRVKQSGIKIKAHFIFGFDNDNLCSLLQLWIFCISIFPTITTVLLLTPLPGSQLFYNMLKQNRITNLNWRHYNLLSLVFKRKSLNKLLTTIPFPFITTFFFLTTSLYGILLLFSFLIITVFYNLI